MEGNLLVCQLSIHGSISVSASLDVGLITSIKINLEDATPINLAAGTLSSNLSGIDDVLKNGILDSRQSSRAGTQSLGLLGPGVTLSENITLRDNDDVTSRKF